MTGYISIQPDDVSRSGDMITRLAGDAKGAVVGRFDSGGPAADKNSGWATGPKLRDFMASFETEMNDALASLQQAGAKIVQSAQNSSTTDSHNAETVTRIANSLNGLK